MKVGHRGGKSRNREKGRNRAGAKVETLDMVKNQGAIQGLRLKVRWKEEQL